MYEKERRDRLNVSFEELRTLLPPSDSNVSLGKAEIINHAVDFIRHLTNEKLKMSRIHSKLHNFLLSNMTSCISFNSVFLS